MGVTVFHSLTATTPDNTQYEIRPSHWNSNHVVSLSIAGSDISNAFTNSPTVTFGSSGAYVTASVATNYIPLANSSSIMPVASSSNFLGTGATGSFINTSVSSSIMPIASSSNFLGSAASGSFIATSVSSSIMPIASSSNFINTSVSSSIMPIASSSNFVNTSVSSRFAGTGTTFSGTNVSGSMTLNSNGLNLALSAGAGGGGNFSAGISTGGNTSGNTGTVSNQIVFVGGNNVTLSGSTAAGGATVTISGANVGGAQTGISGVAVSNTTYTSGTFSFRDGNNISFASGTGQGVSITHNLQPAGAYLTTAMQSNAGSNFLGTNTALTANGVSVTANSSGLSLNFPAFLTTAAQSSASNVSQIIAATNSTGGGTSTLTGGVTFGNSNGLTHYITNGSLVANYTVPTVPTSYVSNVNGSSGAVSVAGLNSAFTNLTATYNTSGLSISAPATSLISATGIVSVSVSSNTISIGAPAFTVSASGNTSGTVTSVSNQLVLAGGNNITLSGSTAAGGMTLTISGPNVGGAQTGISSIAVSNTTYTSGQLSFRDGNNISFASGTGQAVSITHNLQPAGAYLTTAMQSNAGSNFLGTNTALTANGVSVTANSSGLSLNFPAFLTTAAQSSLSNVSQIIAATNSTGGGTSTLTGGVTFGNSNGLTHYITNGSLVANYTVPTVPTSYVSNVNGSSGAVSVAGTGFTSTTTAGTAITAALGTNGLSMAIPQFLTAAGGAQTAISGVAVSNTTYTSGTFSFRDGNNISFASGTGQGVSITHNLQPAGAYLTTAMQSNAGSNFLGTNTALTANGVSVTANSSGLSLNFPAFLTTAAQSSLSNVSQIIAATNSTGGGTSTLTGGVTFGNSNNFSFYATNGSIVGSYTTPTVPTSYVSNVNGSSGAVSVAGTGFTSTTTGGTAVVATLNTAGLSMAVPQFITAAPAQTNQTVGFYASSQTTGQSSSSTFDARSMTFVGAGGVSIGASNGSIIFSGATGGGGGGGGIALAASNTTFTSGTVVMSAAGGALTISSGAQSVLMSVPATSSILAGSGVALSSTSNSIYIYNDFHDIFVANVQGASLTASGVQNALQFAPLYPVDNYSFTCFEQMLTIPVTQVSSSSYQAALTMSYGLYQMDTANASRMSLVQSSSMFMQARGSNTANTMAYTVNFNNSASSYSSSSGASGILNQIGGRYIQFRFPFAGTLQAGEVYFLGMAYSHTFTNNSSVLRPPSSFGAMPHNVTGLGYVGPDTAIANSTGALDFFGFSYTATSGAWPSTIGTNQTSMNASGFMPYLVFKNII